MNRWIYKKDIVNLLKDKKFNSEEEFEAYITPRLIDLFKIKSSQIGNQAVTTSFDGVLSNRADIVIRTNDELKRTLLVIELKLSKSIDNFENGDYSKAVKQLHKYCQDLESLYGILLTDETCFLYNYRYYRYDDKPERNGENRIPNIKRIESKRMWSKLVEFFLYKKPLKFISILNLIINILLILSLLLLLIFFIGLILLKH